MIGMLRDENGIIYEDICYSLIRISSQLALSNNKNMQKIIVFSLFISLMGSAFAQKELAEHQVWNQILAKHVTVDGKVDYTGVKADPSFARYISTLQATTVNDNWTREQKMAYWINVYNAFTIKLIIDNYPIESITKLEKPWDKPFIKIGTSAYSLNQIENDILRTKFKDPRIHFAVNCASFSCPILSNQAYTASNLESQLDKMARQFVNDPLRNKLSGSSAEISKIFEWYAADFGSAIGLIDFLNKYASKPLAKNARITYMEYNWNLNKK